MSSSSSSTPSLTFKTPPRGANKRSIEPISADAGGASPPSAPGAPRKKLKPSRIPGSSNTLNSFNNENVGFLVGRNGKGGRTLSLEELKEDDNGNKVKANKWSLFGKLAGMPTKLSSLHDDYSGDPETQLNLVCGKEGDTSMFSACKNPELAQKMALECFERGWGISQRMLTEAWKRKLYPQDRKMILTEVRRQNPKVKEEKKLEELGLKMWLDTAKCSFKREWVTSKDPDKAKTYNNVVRVSLKDQIKLKSGDVWDTQAKFFVKSADGEWEDWSPNTTKSGKCFVPDGTIVQVDTRPVIWCSKQGHGVKWYMGGKVVVRIVGDPSSSGGKQDEESRKMEEQYEAAY